LDTLGFLCLSEQTTSNLKVDQPSDTPDASRLLVSNTYGFFAALLEKGTTINQTPISKPILLHMMKLTFAWQKSCFFLRERI
jgi:hypothetical protein